MNLQAPPPHPTPMDDRLVLVAGATGQQGGAVAHHLLDKGFKVRALTRDPGKPAATALAGKGAELARGDLNDPPSVKRALDGVTGVFSVQNFHESGAEGEVRQGTALADAAKEAGVRHFVYSSVGSANRNTGIPHFETKWKIEQHLRSTGLSYTILRPVFFMDNWANLSKEAILGGTLPQPLAPGTRLQQIGVSDIGAFAAMAFEDEKRWAGREIELAGDEPSMTETAAALSKVAGREVRYVQVPWDQFSARAGEEIATMYRWFEQSGYTADIAALRREYPALATLERHLQRTWGRRSEAGAD